MRDKVTKRTVDAAKSGERERFIWDTELRGFGLKVTRGGRKVYIVQYRPGGGCNARTKRYTIGEHGAWTPDAARKEAGRLLAEIRRGADPAAARQADRKAESVAELAERFMSEHVRPRRKSSTATEYRRLIDQFIVPALGRRPVKDVSRAEVQKLHGSMRATPHQANRVVAVVAAMLTWAEKQGLRPDGTNCQSVDERMAGRPRAYPRPRWPMAWRLWTRLLPCA